MGSLLLGVTAAALGVVGIAKRQNRVLGVAVLGAATLALVWQHLVVGIIVVLVIAALFGGWM